MKKGSKHSEEAKKKISENNRWKGKIPWNKGLPKNMQSMFGKKHTEETKRKIGLANSIALKGKKKKPFTKKTKKKMSLAKLGNRNGLGNKGNGLRGEKHPMWQGGISFEPYGLEFNKDLREVIRNRDRRKCQICKKTELDCKRKSVVHHIDYNKQNNNPNNLISLCVNCHAKTNHNRNFWINYFLSNFLTKNERNNN